jgi:WD40 repeat protein
MYSRPVMTSDGRTLVVDHPWNKAGETMVAWSGQVTVLGLPDLAPRATLQIVSGNEGSIGGLDVSPDGKRLVVCASTKDKSWARLAGIDGRAIATIPLDNVESGVCAFTADGRIVIGDANGTVSLFDAAGRKLSSMHGNDGGVYELGRRADGSFLTGGADGKLLLWPRAGGKPHVVGEMNGPVRAIETLGDLVISHGMYDLTVRDARGKLVARLYAGPDQSDSMAVAPGLVAIAEPMIAARTARVRILHLPAANPP